MSVYIKARWLGTAAWPPHRGGFTDH